MLPSADNSCGIPEAVCCTAMYDVAAHLLCEIYDGLLPCLDADPCTPNLAAYVTMGLGDDGITDALTVSFDSAAPSGGSVSGKGQAQHLASPMRGAYTIRLRESGWPVVNVEGNTIQMPDPALQNALARHAFGRGEKMYRTLNSLYAKRRLAPSTLNGWQPGFVQVSPLRPLSPSGGVIGWVTGVTMDLPWGIAGN